MKIRRGIGAGLSLISAFCTNGGLPVRGDEVAPTVQEAIIDAPASDVWKALTTGEGFKAMGVAKAEVDLRVGGKIRSHYDPKGTIGDPNTIENTILSYEPMRMLSIKVATAPENFPFKQAVEKMWTVIRLEPLGAFQTKVSITGMGFGSDDESKRMREFFDKGNAQTLQTLKKNLTSDKGTSDDEALLKLIHSLVGEWKFENEQAGDHKFAGNLTVRKEMDGDLVVADTTLFFDGQPKPHSHAVFGKNPSTNGIHVWNFGERGAIGGGRVRLADGNRLLYEWADHEPGKALHNYYVEEVFEDANSLRFSVYHIKGEEPKGEKPSSKPLVSVLWKRIAPGAPSERQMRVGSVYGDAMARGSSAGVVSKRVAAETIVKSPISEVWDAWTTTQGVKRFFSSDAKIELRVGGPYELYFLADAPKGLQGSESCEVLSYLPSEMLSFSWNAPPEYPEIRKLKSIVVVQFIDMGAEGTRVKLSHHGFGDGSQWDAVHQYFTEAWPRVLKNLKTKLES